MNYNSVHHDTIDQTIRSSAESQPV